MTAAAETQQKPMPNEVRMLIYLLLGITAIIYGDIAFLAPRNEARRQVQAQQENLSIAQKLPSQSLCVRKRAKSFIKTYGRPVTELMLADFIEKCEESVVTDATARAQLNSLGPTE